MFEYLVAVLLVYTRAVVRDSNSVEPGPIQLSIDQDFVATILFGVLEKVSQDLAQACSVS